MFSQGYTVKKMLAIFSRSPGWRSSLPSLQSSLLNSQSSLLHSNSSPPFTVHPKLNSQWPDSTYNPITHNPSPPKSQTPPPPTTLLHPDLPNPPPPPHQYHYGPPPPCVSHTLTYSMFPPSFCQDIPMTLRHGRAANNRKQFH